MRASRAEQFVSEPIVPINSRFLTSSMSAGEPGLPMRFRWRDTEYEILKIIEKWKTTGDDRSGGSERYVRKHWFRVQTTDGTEMQIYFDRPPRLKKNKKRWWLAFVSREENNG